MAVAAVRCQLAGRCHPERNPALHIDGEKDRFEMVWVDAVPNSAEMVKGHAVRDRPAKQFPRETVG